MILVELNKANYEYDVNSLVRAFYPGEQTTILTPESTDQRRQQADSDAAACAERGEAVLQMRMELSEDAAQVQLGERVFNWEYKENALDYKHDFKRFLYSALREFTGKTLPWGSLIGIRPTKIAYGMLDEGKSEQEILDTFTGVYSVSEEKAALGLDIAKREREILKDVHYEGGYSLYIGIPFCPTTCLYCSFTSYPIAAHRKQVETYIDCLIREMDFVSQHLSDKVVDSIYIGGGTPTTLEPAQLERLITALKERFDFRTVKEFTVEAGRADSITREKLEVLHRQGVSRISVNPQTMKQETLDIIGRKASVEQVLAAYRLAREVGFDNINMDIILGLPGELEADVQRTIDKIVELAPDSLTVHSLAIKRASHLSKWIQENGIATLNNTDGTMRIAAEGAKRLGMAPYYLYRQKNMSGNFENVGYAKPDKYGLYNILIMEEKQTIVALGAGSITKRVWADGRIERCDNVKDVGLYIDKIDEMIERKRALFAEAD
ncbi:MAG: coproporphyrinogen dehydrogenase HemZ [Lachnospiraceae bacterium]|nr:coproporphyrinogen dehydrogenase HemZ [Lachnospiraceae bacterium]